MTAADPHTIEPDTSDDDVRHITALPLDAEPPKAGDVVQALCGVEFRALGVDVDPFHVADDSCPQCVAVMWRYEGVVHDG